MTILPMTQLKQSLGQPTSQSSREQLESTTRVRFYASLWQMGDGTTWVRSSTWRSSGEHSLGPLDG